MKVDPSGRLWIAGGPAGAGYVFNTNTGAQLASFQFASAPTFVNDVIATTDATWFTESRRPQLSRVPHR